MNYRIKKEIFVDCYGMESVKFRPQYEYKGFFKTSWYDCYEWYSELNGIYKRFRWFETEIEAREYLQKITKYQTLKKEEIC